MGPDTIAVNK